MSRIRVLVVDDSVVVRKLLCEALASVPEIEVVGSASSGHLALSKIPQLHPDAITLDVEMPGMNGIQTLAEIRRLYPKITVIMCSTLTERGAAVTLEALSLGAADYVTKPTSARSLEQAMASVRQELSTKILSLAMPKAVSKAPTPPSPAPTPRKGPAGQRIDVLAIGTSTGGPNALAEVIPRLPRDFPVPVVAVQHMPPLFTRLLADRLDARSQLRVHEAEAGIALHCGHVWIARGDYHLTVEKKGTQIFLELNQNPPENSCRPAVDVLFRSVSGVYGASTLAVVMTGMGADGARGAANIRETGGEIIVQDEATSVVWGMPGAIVNAGLADKICPLKEISTEIVRRVSAGRIQASRAAAQPSA